MSDSVLTGSAGEHYVLYKLHREGILAAQSPTGARDADILVFDDDGRLREYVGGYDDWLRQRPEPAAQKAAKTAEKDEKPAREKPSPTKRRLSFKETKELETLPHKIERMEAEKTEIIAALSSSEFYAGSDPAQVAATNARLEALVQELDEAYARWELLEDLAG